MALRTITNRTPNSVKFAGVFLTIAALAIQPLVALNMPAVFAAEDSSYSSVAFNSPELNWVNDRTAPSGGFTATDNALTMGVDNEKASSTSGFHRTEGVQSAVPAGTNSIKATLNIDASWASKPVRAGIWGVTADGTDASRGLAYPILEFQNGMTSGAASFRVWDTFQGTWVTLATAQPSDFGSDVTLEVAVNPHTGNYEFYINNELKYSCVSSNYNVLRSVIFNNFNSATSSATDNYKVKWTGLELGVRLSPVVNVRTHTQFSSLWAAIDDATTLDGDELKLQTNMTVDRQVTVAKSVKINGNGHTIYSNFTKTNNSNNAAISIQKNDVVLENIIVDGTHGTDLHGINIYQSVGVKLNDVTTKNNKNGGLIVGLGANVTATNLKTAGNGWYGVNVDKAGATLTIEGTSSHDEAGPDLYRDDISINTAIDDKNNQYGTIDGQKTGKTFRAYYLKLAAPVLKTPIDNGYTKVNDFYFTWEGIDGAAEYEWQSSPNPSSHDGVLNTSVWNNKQNGSSEQNHLTTPQIHSSGANGTWYWQVRAIDSNGVAGKWSSIWKMTIDMVAPNSPTGLNWKTSANKLVANNGVTNLENGSANWTASNSGDVSYYIYKYWNDIIGNPYKVGSEYATTTTGTAIPGAFNQGDGVHHFSVTAVDYAGNQSVPANFKITYDKTAPVVTFIDAPASVKDANHKFNLVATDGLSGVNRWQMVFLDEDGKDIRIGRVPCSPQTLGVNATATCYADADLTKFVSGKSYTARAIVTDKAGNEGVVKHTFGFDNTAPVVSITSVVPIGNGAYKVSGTTNDNTANVVVSVGDQELPAVVPVGGIWETLTGALSVGDYQIAARSSDALGNVGHALVRELTVNPVTITSPQVDAPSEGTVDNSQSSGNQERIQPIVPVSTGQGQPLRAQATGNQAGSLALATDVQPVAQDVVATVDSRSAVLGANTDNSDKQTGEVLGVSDTKAATANLLGLAWYWWLAILAAIAGFWWFLAARKRRQEEAEISSFGA